jgi:hypothetical protein
MEKVHGPVDRVHGSRVYGSRNSESLRTVNHDMDG